MAEIIKGVILNDLIAGIEGEILESKREEAKRAIRGIYSDISRWDTELKVKAREIIGLEGKVKAATEKLDKLRAEDWSALPAAPTPKQTEGKPPDGN